MGRSSSQGAMRSSLMPAVCTPDCTEGANSCRCRLLHDHVCLSTWPDLGGDCGCRRHPFPPSQHLIVAGRNRVEGHAFTGGSNPKIWMVEHRDVRTLLRMLRASH